MRAGTLKDRIVLERWTAGTDPQWGLTAGWTSLGEAWTDVTPVSGGEKPDGAGVQTSVSHRIKMRYRSDLSTKDRALYRGRVLEFVSVIDVDGARRELLIEAREHPQELSA
jgi:SPP1 family predicted phage head-tail adaptor